MYSQRTLILVGICCIFGCAVLFLYVRYDTQRFRASLPKHLVSLNEGDMITDITSGVVCTMAANTLVTEQQFMDICNALSFGVTDTDRGTTYKQLETALRDVYAEDPRVDRFLKLLMIISKVLQQAKIYENGGDLESFLKMEPGARLNEFVSLGIALFKLSNTDAEAVRASAASWADTIYRLEIARTTLPYIQEAVSTGEMMVEEAEVFYKATYNLDVDIEIIEMSK